MTRRRTPADLETVIYSDSYTIAALGPAARQRMEDNISGYPSSTPGASPTNGAGSLECTNPDCSQTQPCGTHNPDATQTLTTVEQLAGQRDKAQHDHGYYTHCLTQAARWTEQAVRLAQQWGAPAKTDTEIANELDHRWCANCERQGIPNSPRRPNGTLCEFCKNYGIRYAPFQAPGDLIDIASRRRHNSADVDRIMTRIHGIGWAKKLKNKPKGKVA